MLLEVFDLSGNVGKSVLITREEMIDKSLGLARTDAREVHEIFG